MATKTSLEHRRKVRALEAKRDALSTAKEVATARLAVVRTELKHLRRRGTQ
jgi:hypothetical protein